MKICTKCGQEKDPMVLEFDHRGNKFFEISGMVKNYSTIKMLELEIEKCEVRCANCHRRKTAKQFGWYKTVMPL